MDAMDRRLIESFQRDPPLCPEPYAAMAKTLGTSEADLLERLTRLKAEGVVSQVGAVVAPHRCGWSTLHAMAVPKDVLDAVAAWGSASLTSPLEHFHAGRR